MSVRIIDSFTGKYDFLSNFYIARVHLWGVDFPSNEHAFVWCKNSKQFKAEWLDLSPGKVKQKGRKVTLHSNWDEVKYDRMYDICLEKFRQQSWLRYRLLRTNNAELIEGNYWHDTDWGVCMGNCRNSPHIPVGQNNLGITLMRVREELRK